MVSVKFKKGRSGVILAVTKPKGDAHDLPRRFYLTWRVARASQPARIGHFAGVDPSDRQSCHAGRTTTAHERRTLPTNVRARSTCQRLQAEDDANPCGRDH